MKIIDIINGEKPSLSFEVFPPKTSDKFDTVEKAALEIADLNPRFMSVTYGAGGGTSKYTAEIAERILRRGVTPLAHLSCISSTRDMVREQLTSLKAKGIENILALRGDILPETDLSKSDYRYASDLTKEIADFGGYCIGGACYPECHPDSAMSDSDLESLKIKAESGCEFFTTQMFFDNNILYNFMYRLLRKGVDVPIVAGIMPVTNAAQIKRICSISKSALPQRFLRIVDRYGDKPEVMKQAGIAYATEQILDLYANGVNAVQIYSMNKPDVAAAIKNNVSEILK